MMNKKVHKTEQDEIEEFGIDVQLRLMDFKEDVIKLIIKLINKHPNDSELGAIIRKNFVDYFR